MKAHKLDVQSIRLVEDAEEVKDAAPEAIAGLHRHYIELFLTRLWLADDQGLAAKPSDQRLGAGEFSECLEGNVNLNIDESGPEQLKTSVFGRLDWSVGDPCRSGSCGGCTVEVFGQASIGSLRGALTDAQL